MKFAIRIAGALAMVGAAVGLAWSNSDILAEANCDFWNLAQLNAEVHRQEKSHEELSLESALILRRVEAKDAVIEALIDGKITLAAAMDQFRAWNAGSEAKLQSCMESKYPGISAEESLYRSIEGFVRAHCTCRQDGPHILARLEREWKRHQRQNDGVF